jgi:hypothetical protein
LPVVVVDEAVDLHPYVVEMPTVITGLKVVIPMVLEVAEELSFQVETEVLHGQGLLLEDLQGLLEMVDKEGTGKQHQVAAAAAGIMVAVAVVTTVVVPAQMAAVAVAVALPLFLLVELVLQVITRITDMLPLHIVAVLLK